MAVVMVIILEGIISKGHRGRIKVSIRQFCFVLPCLLNLVIYFFVPSGFILVSLLKYTYGVQEAIQAQLNFSSRAKGIYLNPCSPKWNRQGNEILIKIRTIR